MFENKMHALNFQIFYFSQNKISPKANKVSENSKSSKKLLHSSLRFPWWFKIIGYFLSIKLMIVSGVFIVIKGISLGNDLVYKWLMSVIISIISSIIITEPIKVCGFSFYWGIIVIL
jgi:hypothetical protein